MKNYLRSNLLNINIVILLLLLVILRLALPQYVKYVLFPLVIVVSILSVINLKKFVILFIENKEKLVKFYPVIFLLLIYIISFLLTFNKNFILVKDFVNVLIVFAVLFFILFSTKNLSVFKLTIFKFSQGLFIVSAIVAILGIFKLFYQLKGVRFDFLNVEAIDYPAGTSLAIDDNFFSLFCILGVVSSIPRLIKTNSKYLSLITQLGIFSLFTNIVLSTSRRGLIIISIILIILLIIWIFSFLNTNLILVRIRKNTKYLLCLSLSLFGSLVFIVFFTNSLQRNRWLSNSNFNKKEIKEYLNAFAYQSNSIFDVESNYSDVDKEIWETDFDPRYPFTGWASGNYSLVNKVIGTNADIVPKGSIGVRIDRTVNSSIWNNDAYYGSKLFSTKLYSKKRYSVSLYCYVSSDFNGDKVRISSHGNTQELNSDDYDLKRKGTWQKLRSIFYTDTIGNCSSYFFVFKNNDSTLNNLKGYVIYAYPEFKEIFFNPRQPISWIGVPFEEIKVLPGNNRHILPDSTIGLKFKPSSIIKKDDNIYSYSKNTSLKKIGGKARYLVSIYVYVSDDFNGNEVYLSAGGKISGTRINRFNLKKKGSWEKLFLSIAPKEDNVPIFIGFNKEVNNSNDSLKGYVLFSYFNIDTISRTPQDPYSYSSELFKEEFPLKGNNAQIVPKNTKGCRFDKTYTGYPWKNLCVMFNEFDMHWVEKGDSVYSSVYCYISQDFNGDDVRVEIRGKVKSITSLKEKGRWIKIQTKEIAMEAGEVNGVFFFSKYYVNNFSTLNGYVIFAYPELKIRKKNKKLISYNNYPKNKFLLTKASIFPNFNNKEKDDTINYELIRTNFSFKQEMINDHFAGTRIDRWRYALYLYKFDYKWWQKIFGGGFGFTRKFAKEFNDPDEYDYPHNPFLGILLYSGIIGLIVYIWFLFKAIYYYWLYRREYWTLGLSFGAAFFFAFFSANTPFDPAILGVLTILPYFIHYYHLKENLQVND